MTGQSANGSTVPTSGRAQAGHSGERRQVTVLFYDIVNSTGLLHQLDPEDFGHAQRVIHSEAVAAIRRNGGHMDRILGDGGCAYFGYPEPAEDAAEAAVDAALDLIQRCKAAAGRLVLGQPLQVRVGVATGLVVLSSGEGSGLPTAEEIIGVAPALAARIQTEAAPDSIIVADTTYRITQRAFAFEPLGPRPLKGFGEPQNLWRPLAKRPAEDRFTRLRGPEIPLVAREDELALCRRRWRRAREGTGQIVLVKGEAGIGKSRLVTALRHEIASMHDHVRVLQCEPRGETRPLHPLLDLLRREMGGSDDQSRLPLPEKDGVAALMASFLKDGPGPGASDADQTSAPSVEAMRRVIDAALDLVRVWCGEGFQVLIFEDMHWADSLTSTLLARLIEEAVHMPLFIVVTTRGALPADVVGEANVLTLSLSRLDKDAVAHLVETIWSPSQPPHDLAAFVHERSDGVPLFVEELTRFLKDRFGNTATDVIEWQRVLREGSVTTLQDFITARLGALGQARRLAQIASVIGREFPHDLLLRLMGGEATPDALEERLGRLVEAGLVRRGADQPRTYRFRHVLIQEAAYESLLKSERRELHARIVAAGLAGTSLPDDVMAWHCDRAGRPLDAAKFAIRAGESCAIRSALHEAQRLLDSAEDHLSSHTLEPRVTELMLQLLMTRGPVVTALFGVGSEEARSVYARGVEICRDLPNPDPERWFPLYWGWWFTSPDYGTHRLRSEVLVDFAEKARDPEIRLQAIHCAWATDFNTGHHRDCVSRIGRGLSLYDPSRALESRARYGGHDAQVCALAERGLSLWFLGDVAAARDSVRAAVDWAETLDHPGSLCHALDFALMLCRYEGNAAGAAALAERIAGLAEANELPGVHAKSRIFAGWAKGLTTSLAEGLRELEGGLARQQEIGTEEDFPVYVEMQAELLGMMGEARAGVELLDDTIARAERVGHLFWVPELYRRRALLSHAAGDEPERWIADLKRAIVEATGAPTLAARARADLARLGAGAT
jgi:class 3 adenylate cyclase/predicted ATPase